MSSPKPNKQTKSVTYSKPATDFGKSPIISDKNTNPIGRISPTESSVNPFVTKISTSETPLSSLPSFTPVSVNGRPYYVHPELLQKVSSKVSPLPQNLHSKVIPTPQNLHSRVTPLLQNLHSKVTPLPHIKPKIVITKPTGKTTTSASSTKPTITIPPVKSTATIPVASPLKLKKIPTKRARVTKPKVVKPVKPKQMSEKAYLRRCEEKNMKDSKELYDIEQIISNKFTAKLAEYMPHLTDPTKSFESKMMTNQIQRFQLAGVLKNIIEERRKQYIEKKLLGAYTGETLVELKRTFPQWKASSKDLYKDYILEMETDFEFGDIFRGLFEVILSYYPISKYHYDGRLLSAHLEFFDEELTVHQMKNVKLWGEFVKKAELHTPDPSEVAHHNIIMYEFKRFMESKLKRELSYIEVFTSGDFKDEFHSYSEEAGDEIYIYNCGPATNMVARKLVDAEILDEYDRDFVEREHAEGKQLRYIPYTFEKIVFAVEPFSIVKIKRKFLENFDFKFINSKQIEVQREHPTDMLQGNEVVSDNLSTKYDSDLIRKTLYRACTPSFFSGFHVVMY